GPRRRSRCAEPCGAEDRAAGAGVNAPAGATLAGWWARDLLAAIVIDAFRGGRGWAPEGEPRYVGPRFEGRYRTRCGDRMSSAARVMRRASAPPKKGIEKDELVTSEADGVCPLRPPRVGSGRHRRGARRPNHLRLRERRREDAHQHALPARGGGAAA